MSLRDARPSSCPCGRHPAPELYNVAVAPYNVDAAPLPLPLRVAVAGRPRGSLLSQSQRRSQSRSASDSSDFGCLFLCGRRANLALSGGDEIMSITTDGGATAYSCSLGSESLETSSVLIKELDQLRADAASGGSAGPSTFMDGCAAVAAAHSGSDVPSPRHSHAPAKRHESLQQWPPSPHGQPRGHSKPSMSGSGGNPGPSHADRSLPPRPPLRCSTLGAPVYDAVLVDRCEQEQQRAAQPGARRSSIFTAVRNRVRSRGSRNNSSQQQAGGCSAPSTSYESEPAYVCGRGATTLTVATVNGHAQTGAAAAQSAGPAAQQQQQQPPQHEHKKKSKSKARFLLDLRSPRHKLRSSSPPSSSGEQQQQPQQQQQQQQRCGGAPPNAVVQPAVVIRPTPIRPQPVPMQSAHTQTCNHNGSSGQSTELDQAHLNQAVRAAVSAACASPPPPPPKPARGTTSTSPAHYAQRLHTAASLPVAHSGATATSTGAYCAGEDSEENDGPMPPPPPPLNSAVPCASRAVDDTADAVDNVNSQPHNMPAAQPGLVQLACASVSTGDSVTDSPMRFAVIPESPPFSTADAGGHRHAAAVGARHRDCASVQCANSDEQYASIQRDNSTPRPASSASYPAGRATSTKGCNAVGGKRVHHHSHNPSEACGGAVSQPCCSAAFGTCDTQPRRADDDAAPCEGGVGDAGDLSALRPSTSSAGMEPLQQVDAEGFVSLAGAVEAESRERSVSPSLRPLAVCQIHTASCSDCRHVFADFVHTSTAEPAVERAFLQFGNRTCTSYRLQVRSLRNPVDLCALPNGCLAVADYDNGFMVLNRAGDVVRHDAVADKHNACGVAAICLPDGHFRFVVLAYKDGVWSINIYTASLELKETVLCPEDTAIETWAVRKMSLAADGRLYLMATGEHKLAIWSYEFESRTWRTLVTENSRKGAYNDFAARYDTDTHETHFLLCDWRKAQLSTIVVTERIELAGIQSIKMRRAKGQEWIVQGPKLARWDSHKDILMYDGSGKVFLFDGQRYRCKKIVADMGRGEVGALATAGGWCFVLCRHRCALEAYLYGEADTGDNL